jgi:hypothetical protein
MPLLRLDVVPDAVSPGVASASTTARAAALVAHNNRLRPTRASRAPAGGSTLRQKEFRFAAPTRVEEMHEPHLATA